ncbi:MAG: hypothetical protein J6X60_12935 [Ruminiclostridium sp.]|nr:hypothetical protein [Ruminiclostridium sp.]
MRYNMTSRDELSSTEKKYRAAKWLIFSLLLLVFYVIMRAGIFGAWQPILLIPLAAAVSMYEDELSSCIFALFCGLMIDIAYDFLFGFSAVWLMTVCVFSALLVRNLIRVNLFNYCIVSSAAVFLEFSMDYLFNIVLWNIPKGEVILTVSILPTALSTVVISPAVYYLVRFIENRLKTEDIGIIGYDTDSEDKDQGEKE